MEKTIKFISQHEKKLFHYWECLKLIETAQKNLFSMPDVSIETCKSLLEWFSKNILFDIDDNYIKKEVDALSFSPLIKRCLSELWEYDNDLETDRISRFSSMMHYLGEIRNRRGDISHWKKYPKDTQSSSSFAIMIYDMTDSVLFYLLQVYIKIDRSYLDVVWYDENPDFNDELDLSNDLLWVSYSKALYDQDYTAYIELLENNKYE
jgi:hypothetical protein